MYAAKVLAICFAVLAALGVTGIALAAPALSVNTSAVTPPPPPPTPFPTPRLVIGDVMTPPETATVTATIPVTVTPTVTATVPVTTTPTVTATAASNEKVADAIAKFFGVPAADVLKQHDDGIGYGELVIAYGLAQQTGKTVEDILAMKQSGEGWGKIAQTLDVKPGKWGVNLGQIMSGHASPPWASATPPPDNSTAGNRSTGPNKNDDKKETGKGNNGNGKGKGK